MLRSCASSGVGAFQPAEQRAGEEDRRGDRAADARALQPEQQEMPLELARDIAVLGADEVQHLDDDAVAGHGAARREDDAERRRGEDQRQDEQPEAASSSRAIEESRCSHCPWLSRLAVGISARELPPELQRGWRPR